MAPRRSSQDSQNSREIQGHSLLPGRSERLLDGVFGQDLGSARARAEGTSHRTPRGVSALSAINKQGHLVFRLHEKRIASAEVIEFLDQMLQHHPRRHLVVVMDQAPPHVSQKTSSYIEKQRRLHVFYLPKYSPDWNPDEKVWNHLKHQELKSHQAKTKAELKSLTHRKLRHMSQDAELLRGLYFRCYVADFFG